MRESRQYHTESGQMPGGPLGIGSTGQWGTLRVVLQVLNQILIINSVRFLGRRVVRHGPAPTTAPGGFGLGRFVGPYTWPFRRRYITLWLTASVLSNAADPVTGRSQQSP